MSFEQSWQLLEREAWDTIVLMIRGALSAQVSIDRIYSAYGRHNNVTTIINRMRKDRKENYTPPQLRVG